MSQRMPPLVYLMGPSGAGKDTLLAYARARLDPTRVLFAHRYITRPDSAGGENHVALSAIEFEARRAAGLFALSWQSHGYCYGIGTEIDLWRKQGFLVVVSGARSAWLPARQRYPDAIGIMIEASVELRAARLALRGREETAAIRERLDREVQVDLDSTVQRLDNSGSLVQAGEALTQMLESALESS
jgi:ribose 1,5-bisphosphokinase